ncbi:MAG: hypothetical protein OXF02_06165 [Simkaniaceae bacterium]|nr:hypothetical protein [Simkaniaceae bacterium]
MSVTEGSGPLQSVRCDGEKEGRTLSDAVRGRAVEEIGKCSGRGLDAGRCDAGRPMLLTGFDVRKVDAVALMLRRNAYPDCVVGDRRTPFATAISQRQSEQLEMVGRLLKEYRDTEYFRDVPVTIRVVPKTIPNT